MKDGEIKENSENEGGLSGEVPHSTVEDVWAELDEINGADADSIGGTISVDEMEIEYRKFYEDISEKEPNELNVGVLAVMSFSSFLGERYGIYGGFRESARVLHENGIISEGVYVSIEHSGSPVEDDEYMQLFGRSVCLYNSLSSVIINRILLPYYHTKATVSGASNQSAKNVVIENAVIEKGSFQNVSLKSADINGNPESNSKYMNFNVKDVKIDRAEIGEFIDKSWSGSGFDGYEWADFIDEMGGQLMKALKEVMNSCVDPSEVGFLEQVRTRFRRMTEVRNYIVHSYSAGFHSSIWFSDYSRVLASKKKNEDINRPVFVTKEFLLAYISEFPACVDAVRNYCEYIQSKANVNDGSTVQDR